MARNASPPGEAAEPDWRDVVRGFRAAFPDLTVREVAERCGVRVAEARKFLEEENAGGRNAARAAAPRVAQGGATELQAWRVAELPGRGVGMVAARDIAAGELLLQERPLLEVSDIELECDEHALRDRFRDLSEADQERYMALADAHTEGGKTVEGIYRTNCFSAGTRATGTILCETISRFNHSCAQNVAHAWAPPFQRVYAVRDIREGEELCTCYWGAAKPYAERQEHLARVYNFACTCVKCTAPPEEREASDARRAQYEESDELIPIVGGNDPKLALRMCVEIMEVMESEDSLWQPCLLKRHAYSAFQMACCLHDLTEAKRWIGVAHENCVIENGSEHQQTRELARYLRDPTCHRNWSS